MKTLKSLSILFCLTLLVACGGSKFNIAVKENIETEYGQELDTSILFDKEKSDKNVAVKEVKDFDPKKIGEQEITATFALNEETEVQKIKVTVKDTTAPEITFKSDTIEVTLGDEIDTVLNIESVKDPVDGDIKQSTDNTITKDGYFITADIKSEAGEYTVTVTAFDKNGNKAEKSYKLVIKDKEQEAVSTSQSQGTQSYQAPAQSNQSSGGNNASSSQPTQSQPEPSQPKFVCPNGNEPQDPNLPCNTILTGRADNYSQCYKDASGNPVTFSTPEAAYDWAMDKMLNDRTFTREYGYSNFVTTPLLRNDGSSCDCVSFE